jgi:S1-C subfamily serine protease
LNTTKGANINPLKAFRLTLALLLSTSLFLKGEPISEIVKRSKPAILEIIALDGSSKRRLGTAFFVSADGLAITNFYVIDGACSITAINENGALFLLQKIISQPRNFDLAVLNFQAHDVPFLILGKSIDKSEGQKVIVIGNPRGLTGTVSDGLISAFREDRSIIQITAPISPGSSGSPVLDENGQVIAIVTTQNPEGQNLNFTIAVEKISAALATPEQYSDLIGWGWDDAAMEDAHTLTKTVPDVAYIDRDTGKPVAASLHQHPYDPKDRTTAPALQEAQFCFAND